MTAYAVLAPRSYPNISLSSHAAGIAEQLIATKRLERHTDARTGLHLSTQAKINASQMRAAAARFSGTPLAEFKRAVVPGTIEGIIDQPSNLPVDQAVDTLTTILQSKGITLFAVVDHSGEAAKAGMNMRPTKLLMFGNPKAGTPLMLAAPSVAIDLPLKILIWQDAGGKVWLSYNSPEYLKHRHGLPSELLPNIEVVETLAQQAAK
jgi:uncharacterized protein (DUF302 family)